MEITGGCVCGAVRYRVDAEPQLNVLCFCRDCLSSFGCDGYPGMMVANQNFTVVQGETACYSRSANSGRQVTRHFCATCGTNVWGETELDMVSVVAGTLDDPSIFVPEKAVFTEQAPSWARIPKQLIEH